MFNLASRKFFLGKKSSTGFSLYAGGVDTGRAWGDAGLSGYSTLHEYRQIGTADNWSKVACGDTWTIAIREDGTMWSCGTQNRSDFYRGGYNPLGLGNLQGYKKEFTQIGTDTNWSDVWACQYSSFALKTNGTLWAWGDAYTFGGGLGIGPSPNTGNICNTQRTSSPQQIGSATNWTNIFSTGGPFQNTVIAANSNGELYGWGDNSYYKLGLPLNNDSYCSPESLTGATGWTSVAMMGEGHAAAAIKNGELWTCGRNNSGQLGLGDNVDRTTFTRVGTSTDWEKVFAGNYSFYAIKTNGTLWGWGENGDYQLGIGNNADQNSPVQIGSDTDWEGMVGANNWYNAGSGNGTLFKKTNGEIYAIGRTVGANGTGVLKIDITYPQQYLDVRLESLTYIPKSLTGCKDASIGDEHSMVIKSDGTMIGLGYGERVGIGYSRNEVYKISEDNDWYKILGGRDPANGGDYVTGATFIVKNDGTLWGAGRNTSYSNGSVWGYGESSTSLSYVNFTQIGTDTFWKDAKSLSTGYYTTLMIKGDGTLWYTGIGNAIPEYNNNGRTLYWTQYGSDTWKWVSLGSNGSSAWGIKSDGTLWSWGLNNYGQLGLGDTTSRYSSIHQVGSSTNWVKIWNSWYSSVYGLRSDGTLWSWGRDRVGSLGTNQSSGTIVTSPLQIGSDTDWVDLVSTAYGTTFALKNNGEVWTWGDNTYNSTYTRGDYYTPVQFGTDSNYIAVFANGRHRGVFFKSDGTIVSNEDYLNGEDLGKYTNIPIEALTDIGTHPFTEYSDSIKDRFAIQADRFHCLL